MEKDKTQPNQIVLDRNVMRAVARLKAGIMALIVGLLFGIVLFAMTAILLIENGPNTGHHLSLLSHYFVGYSVTWKGAWIGVLWAFIVGAMIGWSVCTLYNFLSASRNK